MKLELCPKPIQKPNQFPPKSSSFFPKPKPVCPKDRTGFSQKWNCFFSKVSGWFPHIGGWFPHNRTCFPKTEPIFHQNRSQFFLLEQSRFFPKTYFLLLLQFRISTHRLARHPNETTEFEREQQNWTKILFICFLILFPRISFPNGFSFQAFGCNLLNRLISFPDCMDFMISFPNPVDFITKHVGFVFTRVLYFCLCRPFSSSHCTWRNFFADNCKFWTLQCSLFFGHACTGIAGICFSLNFILVTELSAQTISGMNAVSNINLSSWYVHRDV